jgi:hypothetical protein
MSGASSVMKLTPWYLAALFPFAVLALTGAFTGQIAILAVVVGIFVGTLTLNKARDGEPRLPTPSPQDAE